MHEPICEQPVHEQPHDEPPRQRPAQPGRRLRRRASRMRFMRGYLMLVGAGTTVFLLVRLIILLLVELQSWMASRPIA